MNFRIIPSLAFLLVAFSVASAQQGVLQGLVLDARTGLPVAGASLQVTPTLAADSVQSLTLSVDSAGNFAVQLAPGTVEISASAPGYEATRLFEIPVRTGSNPSTRVLLYERGVQTLGSTQVQATAPVNADPRHSTSVTRLTRDQINNSPGSSQDVNRVLTSLPSVTPTADNNWNSFVVRGGSTSENMFLLDGIELANLSHWGDEYTNGGAIGMLHLDFVRDLDFYAGGLPASTPGRLSSVTDIRLREGDLRTRHWQFDFNMAGMGGFAEGPVIQDQASYMVSGRVSFLQLVSLMMPYNGVPEYRNAQSKLFWKLGDYGNVSWNLLGGDERIVMDNGREGTLASEGAHLISGLTWDMRRPDWNNQMLFSGFYSDFRARQTSDSLALFHFRAEQSKFQLKDQVQFFVRDADIVTVGFAADRSLRLEDYREDNYFLALQSDSLAYLGTLPAQYPDSLFRDTLGGTRQTIDTLSDHLAAHANYQLDLGSANLQAGARHDYYRLLDAHGLSPRVSYTQKIGAHQSASLSGALLYQFPESMRLMELLDNDSGYTLQQIPLQRAWNVALGYKRTLGTSVTLDVETYFKWYDREALFALDSAQGERNVTPAIRDFGHRRATGLELHLQKRRQDRFYYELAYSFAIAEQEYATGEWLPTDDNLRHSAKLILGSRLNQAHTVSGRLDLSEGRPFTPIDTTRSLAQCRTVYNTAAGWNSERRDPIVNLALRYAHNSYYRWGRVENYVELTNLLNRTYPVQEYYERGHSPADGRIATYDSRGIFFVGGVAVNF